MISLFQQQKVNRISQQIWRYFSYNFLHSVCKTLFHNLHSIYLRITNAHRMPSTFSSTCSFSSSLRFRSKRSRVILRCLSCILLVSFPVVLEPVFSNLTFWWWGLQLEFTVYSSVTCRTYHWYTFVLWNFGLHFWIPLSPFEFRILESSVIVTSASPQSLCFASVISFSLSITVWHEAIWNRKLVWKRVRLLIRSEYELQYLINNFIPDACGAISGLLMGFIIYAGSTELIFRIIRYSSMALLGIMFVLAVIYISSVPSDFW